MERDVRMWNCTKCNTVNEDLYPICPKCGASRGVGRFGSAAPVKNASFPQETPAQPRPNDTAPKTAAPAPVQQLYVPQPDKVRAGGGVRFFGRLLMLLFPLLTALVCYLKFDGYLIQLSVLLFGSAATEASVPLIAVYVLFSLGAVLLSLLPGVWTLAIGKLLLRFARMEELL